MVSYVVVRMDYRKLKRRRVQEPFDDAEVLEELEVAQEIAEPEGNEEADVNEEAGVNEELEVAQDDAEENEGPNESDFKESVVNRVKVEAAAKLAKAEEGLAIAISEEAATRNELDKLSANVFAWRQKVEEAENELVDIEKNVSFCNQQQQKNVSNFNFMLLQISEAVELAFNSEENQSN